MRLLKVTLRIILFCLLTVMTQVGGFVFLFSILTHKIIDKWTSNNFLKTIYRFTSFLTLYCLTTFVIVPVIAKPLGRVPLPLTETNHLQPLNILTCFFNRNYVRPELKKTAFEVANQMNDKFPGTTSNYLDANFPFIDKFPLIPHLSHNDGKKLDLSFCYRDAKTSKPTNECPSFIGYGICEEPRQDEKNTADFCDNREYWQYSFLTKIIPQDNKQDFTFDSDKTGELVNLFATQPTIGKIFIEPHLKTRLNLTSEKIRFHGCQAVRHDDHIHVQLK
ncbi:MAG: hypothetical protein IPN13_10205 [Bacteroidetes bacterium]|nr:hypothetical protein [Bacteroidota bacterium]